ncbi:MAG TPA: molybdopterin-dependent oxidoreductase [Candidatus Latescibacteria bacterium]|nr:molybdopterin-dependent oxidoreductase [Candidatus Latescibacterota bacterium]
MRFTTRSVPVPDRRKFIKSGAVALVSAILPVWGCDSHQVQVKGAPTAPGIDPDLDDLPLPPITPNDRFYLQSYLGNSYDPELAVDNWHLRVGGLVGEELTGLSYEQITALPLRRQMMTMQCIGNWSGGPLVGNAEWGGTTLSHVLDMAGIRSEATRVKLHSFDGYSTSIPLERALRDEVILAWEMNGEPLPARHGFPLRLINPGHYGQKMPKWITRIELIDEAYLGYWERKPEDQQVKWSDEAVATVNSRIDAPLSTWDDTTDTASGGGAFSPETVRGASGDSYTIHGIAMAGERTLKRVEVSTDDGRSWADATITSRSLPNVWVTWTFEWAIPSTADYYINVRATDIDGVIQPEVDEGLDVYDGRTSWHRVFVVVIRRDT